MNDHSQVVDSQTAAEERDRTRADTPVSRPGCAIASRVETYVDTADGAASPTRGKARALGGLLGGTRNRQTSLRPAAN